MPAAEAALPPVATQVLLLTTPRGTFTATLFDSDRRPNGRRPVVLLLHGLCDIPDPSFAPLARRLVALGFVAVAPYSRGMEPPSVQPVPWGGYHCGDLAHDVLDWIALLRRRGIANDVDGVVLVGHNAGGAVAQTVPPLLLDAAHRASDAARSGAPGGAFVDAEGRPLPDIPPAALRGVVLLGIPPADRLVWWLWHPALLRAAALMLWAFLLPFATTTAAAMGILRWAVPRVWAAGAGDATPTAPRGVVRYVALSGTPRGDTTEPYRSEAVRASTSSVHSVATGVASWHRCLATTFTSPGGLRAVRLWTSGDAAAVEGRSVPTLALRGEHDGFVPAAVFRRCCGRRALLPTAVTKCVACVPGCGHWLHHDDPDAVAAHIAVFVARYTVPNAGAV